MEKVNIEEIIADARAEEEVLREQHATQTDFRDQLREHLRETFKSREENTVNISLQEYVILRQKETDLDRLLNAVVDNLRLSYSGDSLIMDDNKQVADFFKALYPDAYDNLLACELDKATKREKEAK